MSCFWNFFIAVCWGCNFFSIICILSVFVITGCARVGEYNKEGLKTAQQDGHQAHVHLETGRVPYSVTAADFNGDGYTDLAVVGHASSDMRIYWGRPGRRFEPGPVYGQSEMGYHPGMARTVDWDGDVRPDIVIACEGRHEVQLWKNIGSGFKKAASFSVTCAPVGIAIADLDGDGNEIWI